MIKKAAAALILTASLVTGGTAIAGAGEKPGCPSPRAWNRAALASLPHSPTARALYRRCVGPI